MSDPMPKVKPYDPFHLAAAKSWLEANGRAPRDPAERTIVARELAKLLAQWEESGWMLAMGRVRSVLAPATRVLTPTMFEWEMRRVLRSMTQEKGAAK